MNSYAHLAERYGWINRALPASAIGDFVKSLAHRIAGFSAAGHVAAKDRVNAITLAPAEDLRRDSDLFVEGLRDRESQIRLQAAMKRGFQTREAEMELARCLATWLMSNQKDDIVSKIPLQLVLPSSAEGSVDLN